MGVSKFDGYEFKTFTTEDGLADNTTFGIYEDYKNRIWFRSISGKISYYENGIIRSLSCNDTLSKVFFRTFISSIYVDKGDTVWMGVTADFYIKLIPGGNNHSLKKIPVPAGKYIIHIDDEGYLFGGSTLPVSLLTAYTKDLKKQFEVNANFPIEKGIDTRFYLVRLQNGHYMASINRKLFCFDKDKILASGEEKTAIIHLIERKDRSIVSASYDGVTVYKNDNLQKVKTIQRLRNKITTGICIDKEDGTWVTTEGQGLFYIPHQIFSYYTLENGLPESKISCIGIHGSNAALGHLDGKISILYEDSIETIAINPSKNNWAQSGRVTSINTNNGKTFITTMRNGGFLTGKKYEVSMPIGMRKSVTKRDGALLILGFWRFISSDGYRESNSVTINERTENILEDSNKNIWICSNKGMYVYSNSALNYLGTENKLFSVRAVDLIERKDKSIWIATRGEGIVIKNGSNISQITEANGLAGNMCRSIYSDSTSIWVGTNKGLSKISFDGNEISKIENFYSKNGLLNNEVNGMMKLKNKLWLAHNNGVSVLDLSGRPTNISPPPVYIVQTLVNDSMIQNGNLSGLEHDQNYLTVNYIGLSYKDPGNLEYKYKITGIDSNWIHTNYTSVKYQTLQPGSYRFLVYAKNSDGVWSKDPAMLQFTIKPAWWQTLKFKAVVTLTFLIIMLLLFKWRLRIISKRADEKAFLQNRIAITELQALRAQMNPHFIYNAINSVQYFITNNDPRSSQKYLAKFARLIRYVVDNSKPASIPLQTEIDALILYLDLEALRFEKRFEYNIKIGDGIDTDFIHIPSMLIQPYVENAIWHGLMHKEGSGRIDISFSMESDILKCVIEDNGIGRKRSQQIKEKDAISKRSLGMSITKERLEIINQMNNAKLSVVITDLVNEKNEGTGTKVELFIPFN
jgi:ligand-binding sensor domain-containing protein